ncbi:hypothetical protein Tco_1336131 [Tanacetum coccineum]
MDPTSSLGMICLGESVYASPSEKVEGHVDWNAPEYTDTAGSGEKKVTKAFSFYKMETKKVSERYTTPCFVNGLDAYDGEINLAFDENLISNEFAVKLCLDYEVTKGNKVRVVEIKKRAMENFNLFYSDIRPSSSTGRHLTQEKAAKEALSLRISKRFDLFEEVRLVLETMAYSDKYKKVLDEIWADKVELDGMIEKKEEEAIIKVKGEALKEKDDT